MNRTVCRRKPALSSKMCLLLVALVPIVLSQTASAAEVCDQLPFVEENFDEVVQAGEDWWDAFIGLLEPPDESAYGAGAPDFEEGWLRHGLIEQIADCYARGIGTDKDIEKAMALLELPAREGSSQAQHYLASLRVFDTDDPELQRMGFEVLESEYVESGSAFAAGKVGFAYQKGLGVEPDQEKATELYEYAARNGMTYWQYLLAHAYEKGYLGLEVDEERSAYWLTYEPKVHRVAYECLVAVYYADGTFPENEELKSRYRKTCAERGTADVRE